MEQIQIDFSPVFADIANLKNELAAVRVEMGKTQKAANSIFGDGEDAKGQVDALNLLQKEYAELRQAANTLRGALGRAYDPESIQRYTAALAKAEEGMRKYERAAKAAGVQLQTAGKATSTTKDVVEGLVGSLAKAAIIVEIVRQVGAFAKEAINMAREVKKAEIQFTGFTGSAEKAKKILKDLNETAFKVKMPEAEVRQAGKALLGFGFAAEDIPARLERIANIARGSGKDFNELAIIYGKARAAGVLYAEDINQLTEAGIPIVEQLGSQLGFKADEAGAKIKKLASEGKIGFAELELAFAELTKQGALYSGQAVAGADATDKLKAAWDKLTAQAGSLLLPIYDALINRLTTIVEKITDVINSQSIGEYFQRNFALAADAVQNFSPVLSNVFRAFSGALTEQKVYTQEELQAIVDAGREKKKLEAAAEAERRKLRAANAKKEADAARKYAQDLAQARINAMRDGMEKELAQEDLRFKTLSAELRKFRLSTAEAEEQHQSNLAEIRARYFFKAENELAEARRASFNQQIQALELEAATLEGVEREKLERRIDYEQQSRELLDKGGSLAAQKVLFEQYQKDIADIDKAAGEKASQRSLQAIQERLAFELAQFDAQQAEYLAGYKISKGRTDDEIAAFERKLADARLLFELEQQKKLLEAQIQFIDPSATVERQTLEARLREVNAQIKAAGAAGGNGGFNLFDSLGLDNAQQQAFQQGVDLVVSGLQSVAQANKDAADAAVESADRRVNAATEALNTELELAELGFANDVDLKRRQLEAAQANQQKALRQQQQAARQELILQSILQAANIASAAASTLKTFNGPLLPIGIALVAAMIGSFVAAKAKAAQAARQQFGDGGTGYVNSDGVVVGNSHGGGGVDVNVEGGEFFSTNGRRFGVVNKRMTAQHFDLLSAVNKNDSRAILRAAMAIQPNREAITAGFGGRTAVLVSGGGEGFTREERRELLSMMRESKRAKRNQTTTTALGSRVVERRGSLTRTTVTNG